MIADCKQNLKEIFKNIDFMCATSDIWSHSNRSFIAVTLHWINDNELNLNSAFVACKRFEGRHTNERVAENLSEIFAEYEINGKVIFITTDVAGE